MILEHLPIRTKAIGTICPIAFTYSINFLENDILKCQVGDNDIVNTDYLAFSAGMLNFHASNAILTSGIRYRAANERPAAAFALVERICSSIIVKDDLQPQPVVGINGTKLCI
jgi:hypothetical protein